MRILIVEDDEGLAELESGQIAEIGAECRIARTGEEALDAFETESADLALLDYSLPDMKIPTLIERAASRGARVPPFIITTGAGDERIAVAMMKLGARDYLVKDARFLQMLPDCLTRVIREVQTEQNLESAKIALEESEQRYRLIAENVGDVIFLYDTEEKRFSYVSPSARRLFAANDEKTIHRLLADFLRPDESPVAFFSSNLRGPSPDSDERPWSYLTTSCDAAGKPIRAEVLMTLTHTCDGRGQVLGVARDVGERLRIEGELKKSLAEKELLLKEVHHRVKNNLQIVSSLINLQVQSVKSKKAISALLDSQSRIRAMAMIHEQLYRSIDLAVVDFADYIKKLTNAMIGGAEVEPEILFDLTEVSLPIDQALPTGLILNELITNALKHAFRDAEHPRLVIEFGPDESGKRLILTVADNGPGLPRDAFADSSASLGLTLVNALTRQIRGKLRVAPTDGSAGAKITVDFPQQ